MRLTVRGDYTSHDHTPVSHCWIGSACTHASWNDFLDWSPAYILINFDEWRGRLYNSVPCPLTHNLELQKRDKRLQLPQPDKRLRQPPLTRVSRQVRDETLPIFYGNHRFVCTLFDPVEQEQMLLAWLEKIGPISAGLIRELYVVYSKKAVKQYVWMLPLLSSLHADLCVTGA